jgi:hypothetical protein
MIYTEEHPDWQSARTREKYLKSAAGKRWLEKYLAANSGDTEFPALLRHAGRESRTGYRALIGFKAFFYAICVGDRKSDG